MEQPVKKENQCNLPAEVYSRVVGYFRPVQNWNAGKREEFRDRKLYQVPTLSAEEETIIVVEDAAV